ncbi:LysR family transcriptional regulator [Streptomyces sp. NHF165]|nr:LysR family transcriptional regulator [Streptomyces cacaoi]QHF97007.1 LysR family transcriptional regulator [Streptomyces sp. NHF165]
MRLPLRLCSTRMTVELRHLRAFLAIAEEGGITRAAARLRMSQPALSRTLRRLEEHLGVRLADRSTHHLELTAQGHAFRDKARAAVAAVDEALDPQRLHTWPLRLGHAWSALGRSTTPLLRRWRAEHPATPLELLRIDDRTAGLLAGRVDAALLRGPVPGGRGLCATELVREPRVAAVPAHGELAARHEALTLADLAPHPVALNTVSGLTTLGLWPPEIRPDADAAVRVANTDDWLGAIAAGGAVGVSTQATAELHPHPGVAYRPLTVPGDTGVPVSLVWRDMPGHPAIPDLVTAARQVLSARGTA